MEFQTALLLLLKMDFVVSCGNPAIFLANFLRLACIIPSRNAIFRKFTSKIIICLVNISFAAVRNTCFGLSVVTTCYSQGIELFALENHITLSATSVHVKRKFFAIQQLFISSLYFCALTN